MKKQFPQTPGLTHIFHKGVPNSTYMDKTVLQTACLLLPLQIWVCAGHI